jgi:sugar phosphate isomerase/epimerase
VEEFLMRLLGRTQMLSQYSLIDSLDVIKRLGFDGVELCVERKDWSLHDLDSMPVDAIRERIAELELAPHSFSWHGDYIYDDLVFEVIKEAIKMTPRLGTNLFVFGGAKSRSGDQEEWSRMVERTRALVETAADYGVILAKEFEPDFVVDSTRRLLWLFEEIPSPHLAANLDLGHAFLNDSDPLQAIRLLGPKIVHCHIENMAIGIHDHLVPQEGDIDLGAYLQTLAAIGFRGGMALDIYKYDYEAVARDAIAYVRGLPG